METQKGTNNVNNMRPRNNTFATLMTLVIFGLIIFGVWKFFIQPVFFYDGEKASSYNMAEYYAKKYLGNDVGQTELTVKAVEDKDGIYIVKCITTNSSLKKLYGSTFYYGYKPNARGNAYKQYVGDTIAEVYNKLR